MLSQSTSGTRRDTGIAGGPARVDDVAYLTMLLALNGAIEAMRMASLADAGDAAQVPADTGTDAKAAGHSSGG